MAIFHLSSQIIKRSEGRNAVACAAYRAGEALHEEREGETFKFQRQDRVVSSEIIAPAFANPWATDRNQLWNSLEAIELRKKAQLAKEIEVALPNDLTLKQQRELLAGWVDEHFTQKDIVADVNIHRAPIGAKYYNDHAHIMGPLRGIDPETGDWKKCKERPFLDKQAELEMLRASWARHVNVALEKAGIDDQQVDHRSHKRRGITDVQPGIHVGYAAQGIEKRGGHSWRAALNRQIHQHNRRILEEIKARATQAANAVTRAATWLARSPGETAPKPAQKPVPKPVLQPPPMRPDKLDEGPEPTPAPKKQEPAPAPIAAKPQPAKLPEMLPPAVPDAEAEKRKKAAQRAAWQQHGGGIGG
jgi:hypothetical protein